MSMCPWGVFFMGFRDKFYNLLEISIKTTGMSNIEGYICHFSKNLWRHNYFACFTS